MAESLEISIPLSDLGIAADDLPEKIGVFSRVCNFKAEKPDSSEILWPYTKIQNFALFLLLEQLGRNNFIHDDEITIAIALAENTLFKLSDTQTRRQIIQDMARTYEHYQRITAWQEEKNLEWNLQRAGTIPKLFWALRYNYPLVHAEKRKNRTHYLNIEQYNILVDRIESYEQLRAIAEDSLLIEKSLASTAHNIEEFVHRSRRYRANIKVIKDGYNKGIVSEKEMLSYLEDEKQGRLSRVILGENRPLERLSWLNFQVENFISEKEFVGDCGNTTKVQIGLYQALGIPALSLQRFHRHGIFIYNHNFPAYYNTTTQRWKTVQNVPFQSKDPEIARQIREFFIHYSKPRYHHWKVNQNHTEEEIQDPNYHYDIFFQGELAPSELIHRSLDEGWTAKHLENMFFSDRTQLKGLLFPR